MTETIFEDIQLQLKTVKNEMEKLDSMFKTLKKEHTKPIEKAIVKKEVSLESTPKFPIKTKINKELAKLLDVSPSISYPLLTKALVTYMKQHGENNLVLKTHLKLKDTDKLTFFTVQKCLNKNIN